MRELRRFTVLLRIPGEEEKSFSWRAKGYAASAAENLSKKHGLPARREKDGTWVVGEGEPAESPQPPPPPAPAKVEGEQLDLLP